jgi:hypothetical protein
VTYWKTKNEFQCVEHFWRTLNYGHPYHSLFHRTIAATVVNMKDETKYVKASIYMRVYPKVSGLAAWNENAVLSVSLVSSAAIILCVVSQQCLLFFFSLSTQSGNFWIHLREYVYKMQWFI